MPPRWAGPSAGGWWVVLCRSLRSRRDTADRRRWRGAARCGSWIGRERRSPTSRGPTPPRWRYRWPAWWCLRCRVFFSSFRSSGCWARAIRARCADAPDFSRKKDKTRRSLLLSLLSCCPRRGSSASALGFPIQLIMVSVMGGDASQNDFALLIISSHRVSIV